MRHTSRLVAAGVALAAALPVLAFPPAPEGSKEKRVVFSTVDLKLQKGAIVIMNADGTDQTTLTRDDAIDLDPALSPDGHRIAFVRVNKVAGRADVWVMNDDGKDPKKLTDLPVRTVAIGVSWSPDGKRIASSTLTNKGGPAAETEVIVMGPDGKNAKSVGKGLLPAWSPDGKQLLYITAGPGPDYAPRLAVMDADGKNAKELTTTPVLMGAWSPDGKKIAYVGAPDKDRKPHLYVSNPDGTGATLITKDSGERGEMAPRWSADGKRIYFNRMAVKGLPQEAAVWVIDADGKNDKQLTKGNGLDLLGGAGIVITRRIAPGREP